MHIFYFVSKYMTVNMIRHVCIGIGKRERGKGRKKREID